jgi:NTE family protein
MKRALVLGGGGSVGFAWESGLIAGFAQAGVDLGEADYILGTSAGAITGARLSSGIETARLAEPLIDPAAARAAAPRIGATDAFMKMLAMVSEAELAARHPAELRREIGELALETETFEEDDFVRAIRQELGVLPAPGWPRRGDFVCTAVDAGDGGFQLWEAGSGVDLTTAVASSCSVPGLFPPVTVQGRRYMDGGMRSATNADLAAGYDVVVVVAVMSRGLERIGRVLNEEVESLKASGSTVVTITPDDGSTTALGHDLMDASQKPHAARAGVAQAASQAAVLKEVWQ